MTPRHQVSRAAIDLIKRFEGYRRNAAQLPDGRWMIGYGHTLSAREGAEVSESDAEGLLLYDLIGVAHTVDELTYAELTRNQFDALCAFAFSIGLDAFRGSDVLKRVNEGAFIQAAFELELWRKAEFEGERIVIDALVRRRAAEKLLFLTPPGGRWRAVPSAVLKPLRDDEALDMAPREEPADGVTPWDELAAWAGREEPELGSEPESPVTAAAEAVSAKLQTLFQEPDVAPSPHGAESASDAEPAAAAEASAAQPEATSAPSPAEAPAQRVIIDDTAPFEFVPPTVQPITTDAGGGVLTIVSLMILGVAFFAGGVFWALNAQPRPQAGVFTPQLVGWLAGLAGVVLVAVGVFLLLQRMTRAAERRDRRLR